MAWVVFLRGVNVGGRRTFQPTALAKELADFDVVNVGAAGTLVVRKAATQAALKAALLRKLPVEAELMICRSREILDLASRKPFGDAPPDPDVTRYVSVLAKVPRTPAALPVTRPAGDDWQVKVFDVTGR